MKALVWITLAGAAFVITACQSDRVVEEAQQPEAVRNADEPVLTSRPQMNTEPSSATRTAPALETAAAITATTQSADTEFAAEAARAEAREQLSPRASTAAVQPTQAPDPKLVHRGPASGSAREVLADLETEAAAIIEAKPEDIAPRAERMLPQLRKLREEYAARTDIGKEQKMSVEEDTVAAEKMLNSLKSDPTAANAYRTREQLSQTIKGLSGSAGK